MHVGAARGEEDVGCGTAAARPDPLHAHRCTDGAGFANLKAGGRMGIGRG